MVGEDRQGLKARANHDRPAALPVVPDNIPAALKSERRWVVWKYVSEVDPDTGEVEWTKPPFNARTRGLASTTAPKSWSTFDEAWAAYRRGGWDGVGFVLHRKPGDDSAGLVGVDLDHCRDPQTGEVQPWALEVAEALDTYAEVSPSGSGLRLFALGRLPPHGRKKGDFECYETARYVTVTGNRVEGLPRTVEPRQEALGAVHGSVFGDAPPPPPEPDASHEANGRPDDEAVIRHARECPRKGAEFGKLYDDGDWSGFRSQSEAELSLVNHLVFWCGRPPSLALVDRLFRQGALYRPKWEREGYRRLTFEKAVKGRTAYYHWPDGDGGAARDSGGAPEAEPADHLVYSHGGLAARVWQVWVNRNTVKWKVAVCRGAEQLGLDVIDLSAARDRERLVKTIPDDAERQAAAALLLSLAGSVEADWERHAEARAERERAERERHAEECRAQAEARAAEVLRQLEGVARSLLGDPALLFKVATRLQARGLVRERENGLQVYLAVVSQVGEEPVSLAIKGDSAAGKSHLVKVVLGLVPDDYHYDFTSMSEKALVYDARDFSHRHIVIYEVHGQGADDSLSAYLIRTLISEKEIRHSVVESTEAGLVSRQVVKEGPTGFITTTTHAELHAENETRVYSVLVDDTEGTTKEVLKVQAAAAAGTFTPADASDLHAAFHWLHLVGARSAVIPFAGALADMMPGKPLRLRRDFLRLLALVETSAVLHQFQRGRDEAGRVLADPADYCMVRALVARTFGRAIAGVTEKTQQLVEALRGVLAEKDEAAGGDGLGRADYSDLVKPTGRDKVHISRWLRPAIKLGLVINDHAGERGKPAALHLGGGEATPADVLPTPAQLAEKLDAVVRWTCPVCGRPCRASPTVSEYCGPDCNTQHLPQDHTGPGGAPESPPSVSVLQCFRGGGGLAGAHEADHAGGGDGSARAHAPTPAPWKHCNTETLDPAADATPTPDWGSDNSGLFQSELQRSATPPKAYHRNRCAYCSREFVTVRPHKRTCSPGCRKKLSGDKKGAAGRGGVPPTAGGDPEADSGGGAYGPDVWTPFDEEPTGG
jgi:hypothetical protein